MWKKLTTYLTLIATLLVGLMFFFNFASIIGPEGEVLKIRYYEKIPYLVMLIMLISGCIFSVLTHRLPFLQARVCMLAALLALGFQIWLGIDFIRFRHDMVFNITGVFPIVCVILDVLAARAAMIDQLTLTAIGSTRKSRKKRRRNQ